MSAQQGKPLTERTKLLAMMAATIDAGMFCQDTGEPYLTPAIAAQRANDIFNQLLPGPEALDPQPEQDESEAQEKPPATLAEFRKLAADTAHDVVLDVLDPEHNDYDRARNKVHAAVMALPLPTEAPEPSPDDPRAVDHLQEMADVFSSFNATREERALSLAKARIYLATQPPAGEPEAPTLDDVLTGLEMTVSFPVSSKVAERLGAIALDAGWKPKAQDEPRAVALLAEAAAKLPGEWFPGHHGVADWIERARAYLTTQPPADGAESGARELPTLAELASLYQMRQEGMEATCPEFVPGYGWSGPGIEVARAEAWTAAVQECFDGEIAEALRQLRAGKGGNDDA